ncbi:15764_t:CDS:2 [Rhizophagus irregularis]|nr:15764_t:CDS:2 [Rhizophagus irregularis]
MMVLKNEAGPMNVALKLLDNSQNISSSYIDQHTTNVYNQLH